MSGLTWSVDENREMIHAAFAEMINLLDAGMIDEAQFVMPSLRAKVIYIAQKLPKMEALLFLNSVNEMIECMVNMFNTDQALLRLLLGERLNKGSSHIELLKPSRGVIEQNTWERARDDLQVRTYGESLINLSGATIVKATIWSSVRAIFRAFNK